MAVQEKVISLIGVNDLNECIATCAKGCDELLSFTEELANCCQVMKMTERCVKRITIKE